MTVRAGAFGVTHTDTATDSSASFQAPSTVADKRFAYLVTFDVDAHLHRTDTGGSATAATTSDMFVPAKTPTLVNLFAGEWLSWVSDTADGNIWITLVDH
jgi:hypothetical protein